MSDRDPIPETIRAQAADWFARAEGDRSEAVEAELEAWLSRDLRHRLAYAEAERTWRESLGFAATRTGRERTLVRAPIHMRRSTHLAAATLAVVLVVGLFSVRSVWEVPGFGIGSEAEARSFQTGPGETRTWQLDGGTALTLSGDSLARLHSEKSASRLELVRGRARIRVTGGDAVPVEIHAAGLSIRTHGAAFDVSSIASAARVDVLSGQVQATLPSGEARTLTQGQTVTVPAPPLPPRASIDPSQQRITIMADMTIGEAVRQLNETNVVQIRLAGGALASRHLAGAFQADDPNSFAEAIAALGGLQVVHSPGLIEIRSR